MVQQKKNTSDQFRPTSLSLRYNFETEKLRKISNRMSPPVVSGLLLVMTVVVSMIRADFDSDPLRPKCIDFELDKIDAITKLPNGTLLMVKDQYYWLLPIGDGIQDIIQDVPRLADRRPITELHAQDLVAQLDLFRKPPPEPPASEELDHQPPSPEEEEVAPPAFTIDAAADVRLKATGRDCLPTSQLVLYSKMENGKFLVTIHEGNEIRSTTDPGQIDFLLAARSVDLTKPIDGITFFNNMTIIFQGPYFTSVRCHQGRWTEILHKRIVSVFPGVPENQTIDSVYIRNGQQLDQSDVFMFFGNQYYACPTTGNDPCQGPHNLMSEFFHVDHFCLNGVNGNNQQKLLLNLITAAITVLAILCVILVCTVLVYLVFKPENLTYFVNGKLRSNYSRDQLSYAALKRQNETAAPAAPESKAMSKEMTTNGRTSEV